MSEKHEMTKDELRSLIKETVSDTLTQLGLENRSPMEMQRDFQFLRKMRKGSESVGKAAVVAIVTTLVGGVLALLWLGFKLGLVKP